MEPQLTNYDSGTMTNIEDAIVNGFQFVLPEDAHIVLNQWRGVGYVQYYQSGTAGSMGMIIYGGYFGGYASQPWSLDPYNVGYLYERRWPDEIYNVVDTWGKDPVNMLTGAFHHGTMDIMAGPPGIAGLPFGRNYHSGRHDSSGTLGFGLGGYGLCGSGGYGLGGYGLCGSGGYGLGGYGLYGSGGYGLGGLDQYYSIGGYASQLTCSSSGLQNGYGFGPSGRTAVTGADRQTTNLLGRSDTSTKPTVGDTFRQYGESSGNWSD